MGVGDFGMYLGFANPTKCGSPVLLEGNFLQIPWLGQRPFELTALDLHHQRRGIGI